MHRILTVQLTDSSLIDLLPVPQSIKTGPFEFISVHTHAHMNACVCMHKHHKQKHLVASTFTWAQTRTHVHTLYCSSLCFALPCSYSHRLGSKASWLILFSSSEDLCGIHLCYSCRGGVGILHVLYVWVGREGVCTRMWRIGYVSVYINDSHCIQKYILCIHTCGSLYTLYSSRYICDGHQMKKYLSSATANYDIMSLYEWW